LHCSASDNPKHDDVSVIKEWHLAKGWSDVGYHYFIKKDGTVQLGRPISKVPAAQYPFNDRTIAICLHGLDKKNFTDAQFKSLRTLANFLDNQFDGKITFHGHCEVNKHKTCPVFDYKKVLNLDVAGHLL
jgi:N-acetyl-anhydromuramyl-L-alanine amidase AmpD